MNKEKLDKYVCSNNRCTWRGYEGESLTAPHPFDKDEIVYGCPVCKGIDTIVMACFVKDCWEISTCGTPTKDGYKRSCSKHLPR